MKKRTLKKLELKKSIISELEQHKTKGGTDTQFSNGPTCPEPFVETVNITICWNGMYCELRDNGC